MAHIAFTPRMKSPTLSGALGVKQRQEYYEPELFEEEKEPPEKKKKAGETFEKVVKRIPTFYVIIFFSVFTACAVLIIWNTLQVNRLTYEKSKLESKIEQTKQRIIKLKA